MQTISGHLVDVIRREIYPATIHIENGKILSIQRNKKPLSNQYLLPGFIDSHIHIESSMLIPSEFARLASPHGTIATVSDPHEIANVLGLEGIRYMIENASQVPFHFFFGAPSCVPATSFETGGATISAKDIEELFKTDQLKYLSEMMNFPGVLHKDEEVMEKIAVSKRLGKPIDGHAPGLKGSDAQKYIEAGISTDHECYELHEALGKIKFGMKIIIREGSAAKNYEALHTLLKTHPESVMFCSDDKHPHELVKGHINELVVRSLNRGYDLFDVLRAVSFNPISHYHLNVGLLQEGDPADFIVVKDLKDFKVLQTYVKGEKIAEKGRTLIPHIQAKTPNHFNAKPKKAIDFKMKAESAQTLAIVAEDHQLITKSVKVAPKIKNGLFQPDPKQDLLKLTVVNRYKEAPPAICFIKNFGLKKGAISSSIAHDSHNIIAVGCSDEEIKEAVNLIIKHKGGIAAVNGLIRHVLPLPVAGIMSHEEGHIIAEKYEKLDQAAKALGSHLDAPFMTLSFMALLVIPELKLSDKGLFDGRSFTFIETLTPTEPSL